MFRRTVIALAAGLAGLAVAAGVPADASGETKGPSKDAQKYKDGLKKLYGKYDFGETIPRGEIMTELQGLVSKDKKDNALKYTQWWSEQILESLYTGEKFVKTPGKTKEIVKGEVECFPNGDEKPAVKATFFYRGPNIYSKGRSAPVLISIVDAKADAKAWIEKSWAAHEDIAKEWVLVAVAESDGFDVAKDPLAAARLLGRVFQMFNIDPNRIFLEGVGSACKSAQTTAMWALPDRLAGLLLRNPSEPLVNKNCGVFPTVVVHGPEGSEKAMAVLAKVKEVAGADRGIESSAPDLASLEGSFQGLADWLRAAKPRETARSYSWTATFDKDQRCPNSWTGSLLILTPVKREEPTTVDVTFARDTNTVDIKSTNMGEFVVFMNDELLDLDREVEIFVNTKSVAKRVFERNAMNMLEHADMFSEWGRLFPAQFRTFVTSQAPGPDKKDGAAPPDKK
jgi:hypothetical protein